MKKLIALSYSILCIVLAVIAYQNYSYDILESIENEKLAIAIEKPKEVTNKEFLKNVEKTVRELNTDIIYKYVDVNGSDIKYMYYMTNNSESFVDTKSALALSNVEFYNLDQADKYDLSTGNYYVSETRCDEVSAGLQERGYAVTITQQAKISGKTPTALFTAIPIILLIMSIIFYIISVGKRTVLRKMEGYTNAAVLKEEFINMIPVYIGITAVIEAVVLFIVNLEYNNSIWGFIRYESGYIFVGIIVIAIAAAISFVCIRNQNKIAYIKGKIPKKGMYTISMLVTIVFMVFIVFFMTIGIRDVAACYNIYKTTNIMAEKSRGYVSIPIYENSASSEGLDNNYLEFYKKTVDVYDGVLIQADNYAVDPISGKSKCEEFDQDSITVNENYLKINPIYDMEGKVVSLADTQAGKVVNVLLLASKLDKEAKYVQQIGDFYNAKANIIVYDDLATDVYSYNATVGNEAYGKINSPVIIVVSTENLTGEFVLSYCSLDCYLLKTKTDSPYDELKPLLQEMEILKVTPQTPFIASNYRTELAANIENLKTYGTQSVFLSIGIILLVLYTAILYCENYRKKIVCKIIEGFSIFQCVRGHIVFKGAIYVVSVIAVCLAEQLSGVGMNYYIILGTLMLDILITMILCNKINKRNVYAVVKGEE